MVDVECHNCKRVWDYQGVSVYYATCPQCYYKVRVDKIKVVDGEEK